jgi:parallel beta-helix repeat protein
VFTGSQTGSGIYFREPTYGLRIENSRTSNNDDYGIHANVGSDMTMLGHVAEANGSDGARLRGRTDAASLVVRNSRASSNDDGFYFEEWGSVEFRDSIAEDNSDSGFEFYYIDTLNMLDNVAEGNGYGFYGYYDYDEDYTNGDGAWTFLRNRIVGNSRGFYAGYIGRMTVRDSSAMDNSQYGFDIEEVYGPMALTGNVASGTDGIGDGFLVTDLPGPLTMRNNRAEDNLGDGFFLNDVDSGLIERNVASSNGSEGFTLDDVDDTRVFRNQATSNSGEGFSLDDIDDSVYARNRSFDNGGDGFYITYTYDTRFERNSAIDNGGDGFESDDDNDNSENLVFRNNEARLNSGDGFNLEDVDVLLAVRNNRAVANGDDGFDFDYLEDLSVTRNLARLNGDDGFYFDTDIDDFVAVAGNRALANFAWGMYHDDGYLIGRRNTAKDNGIGGCYDVDCGRRQTVRP